MDQIEAAVRDFQKSAYCGMTAENVREILQNHFAASPSPLTAIRQKIEEWRRRGEECKHSSRALKTERGKAYLELATELSQLLAQAQDGTKGTT